MLVVENWLEALVKKQVRVTIRVRWSQLSEKTHLPVTLPCQGAAAVGNGCLAVRTIVVNRRSSVISGSKAADCFPSMVGMCGRRHCLHSLVLLDKSLQLNCAMNPGHWGLGTGTRSGSSTGFLLHTHLQLCQHRSSSCSRCKPGGGQRGLEQENFQFFLIKAILVCLTAALVCELWEQSSPVLERTPR